MRIRLCDVIEEMSLESHVEDDMKFQFLQYYSDQEIIDLSEIFLRGIGHHHRVPGKMIFKIASIGDQFRYQGSITRNQRWFLFNVVLENWQQMSVEMRAQLNT
jgi:hypothetical protein